MTGRIPQRRQNAVRRSRFAFLLLPLLAVCACSRVDYRPQPLQPERSLASLQARGLDRPGFRDYLHAAADELPGPEQSWDLRQLTLAAFYHNPSLRVACEQLRLGRARVQTAAQRINPTLSLPLEHHSDTSAGRSPWLFGLLLDFVYERRGKREARIRRAEAELEAARMQLHEVAWDIRNRLHSAYLDYYSARQRQRLLAEERDLLRYRLDLLRQRRRAGYIGAAAVTAVEIRLQRIDLARAELETEINDSYHRLIRLTGVGTTAFDKVEFAFAAFEDPTPVLQLDKDDFRQAALLQRADMRRAVAEYNAREQALRLEIEKQYPDITLSPGFVFDQDDKIWALGTAWMLPVFHNNDGPIAEALAQRRLMQARFMELQTEVLDRLDAALAQFEFSRSAIRQARQLRDKALARKRALENQLEQGYGDRLQTVDAELVLIETRRTLLASRTRLLQAAVELESVTQTPLQQDLDVDQSMERLYSLTQPTDNDV